MPERDFVIVRFVFIFVRADSLQYQKHTMPERKCSNWFDGYVTKTNPRLKGNTR
mgnify:FL=1